MLVFVGGGNWNTREKPLKQGENQHQTQPTSCTGSESIQTTLWEASVLTTVPYLLPNRAIMLSRILSACLSELSGLGSSKVHPVSVFVWNLSGIEVLFQPVKLASSQVFRAMYIPTWTGYVNNNNNNKTYCVALNRCFLSGLQHLVMNSELSWSSFFYKLNLKEKKVIQNNNVLLTPTFNYQLHCSVYSWQAFNVAQNCKIVFSKVVSREMELKSRTRKRVTMICLECDGNEGLNKTRRPLPSNDSGSLPCKSI